ncbi:MAG: cation:dicarboxylase symporter family transporter [Gemmatimonadales bacterium]|nr:cation:dicarboxylase symporter family transporter [Gemmatimonadales bacterium]MDQ3427400.1 cation:dicarboxylase symporter family transporter [Gemmatimonadota bacterium]
MWRTLRGLSLTWWIFIGMGAGILIGWLAPEFAASLKPLSTLFLRMIKSVVVPIIFGTLVIGIAGHGDDLKRIGRLAIKSLSYFWLMTFVALAIGLIAVNLTRPGVGVVLPQPDPGAPIPQATPTTVGGFLEHIVPQSFFQAAANNEVLQVVFWATLFGLSLTQVRGKPKEVMLGFCEGLAEVMFKFVGIVMRYAPIGIGAAMAVTVSHSGIQVLANLGLLVATLYGALIVFALVALVPVALLARIPLRRFLGAVKDPAVIAFTTTSSDAALPMAMQRMIEFGVPRRIVAFVMPTGYSFNLDGSTLYLGVASIFVAQAAGIELTVGQQLIMMLTLLITSKGVAGVPRASLVVLSGTLTAFGLPLEGVAVILGVDELMDMARTMVNLVGNCLATAVMARWEGELGPELPEGMATSMPEPALAGAAHDPLGS